MKLKKTLLVVAATASMFLLAACGKGSSSGSSSSDKTITFWNPFVGADGKNMQTMIDKYNATKPAYKIKNVAMKEGDMYTKIPTVVNSGKNIPDLTIVHAERIKQYKDNGMLQTYDKALADFPNIKADNYISEAWKIGDLDGKRYSVPLDIHTTAMYYNKDLVKKYAPSIMDDNIITYDEIRTAAEAAKKDKIEGIGVTWVKPLYLSLYAQNGGVLSKNGTAPTLDNEAGEKSFQLWADLYKDKLTTRDGEDPLQQFISGKLLFYPEGIWMQNEVKKSKFDWGLTNSPQLSSDISKSVNWSSSHQFVLFKSKERTSAKTKGILKFLEWVRTHSVDWAKAGQNPATLAIQKDKEYLKMPQAFLFESEAEKATLKIFDYKYNGFVADYLDAHGPETIFGKISIKKSLANMQKEVKDKVDKDKSNEE